MSQIEIVEIASINAQTLDELSNLLISVVEDGASVGFLPPLPIEDAEKYWSEVLDPGVVLWVAKENEHIVGTVQLQLALKPNAVHRAEIAKLMVLPNERRKGIARLLMEHAEEKAQRLGRSLLVLDTRAGDPSNHLYLSLGYMEAGRIPGYARSSDGSLHDTVYYYKQI